MKSMFSFVCGGAAGPLKFGTKIHHQLTCVREHLDAANL